MLLNSPILDQLVEAFRRLPGVGKRSAERMAIHILSSDEEEAHQLAKAVQEARSRITQCATCLNLSETETCSVCSDSERNQKLICVVEQPTGAMAIEKGGTFEGVYHVLHGVLNPLDGIGPSELHMDRLFQRIKNDDVEEVVVATNATAEGEATAMYISRQLADSPVKVSRIAHGVPMGGGLEFADEVTLSHALKGRTKLE
ncbi:MAG: recombination mediator RecR [Candidatus Hydrogenedentota bacterium]